MSFLGLPMGNGDYGGEAGSPVAVGGAPTPSDPGSGGTFLNELGMFIGTSTTGISNLIRSINTPSPVAIPRTTNVPSSSLQRVNQAVGGSSSILIWLVVGLVTAFAIKFLLKK